MTSKLVVNTIEADTGISSVSFASSISMSSTSKFHFSNAGIDIGADTNINRPAAGVLGFNINGGEKVRIDSSGRLLVGTSSNSNAVRAVFQGYPGGGDNFQARVQFQTNQATNLASGNHLANFLFTNASNSVGAQIDVKADAAWGTNDYPGRIEFKTTADGANSPTERLRIASGGEVSIGGFAPTAGAGILQIAGGLRVAGSGSASDTNTPYIYRTSGVDNLNFATSGVERLRITSGGDITHTGGRIYSTRASGEAGILLGSGNAGGATVYLDGYSNGDWSGSDYAYIRHNTSGDLEIHSTNPNDDGEIYFSVGAGAEKVRINQHGGLRVFAAASDPTGIQAGEIYYNTTTNRLRVYNGSKWLNPDENKDPYASSVVCLFNGDSYTDLTGRHTLTQVGAGGLSNNYMSPVGSTSTYRMAHSNGTGNYMNITGNLGDFRLDDGNWTMEFWVRTTGTNGYQHYFIADGQGTKGTFKGYTNNSSVTEMAYFYSSNGQGVAYNPGGSPFAYNDWQHYAWDRTGSTTRFYLDGVVRASSTAAYPGGNPTFCHIGKWSNEAREFYMDNFRFTRGVARYGGNGFEVPRTKYSSG